MQKLRWGLIGGGEGSQIGFTHRAVAQLEGNFYFDSGALDVDLPKQKNLVKLGLSEKNHMVLGKKCWKRKN